MWNRITSCPPCRSRRSAWITGSGSVSRSEKIITRLRCRSMAAIWIRLCAMSVSPSAAARQQREHVAQLRPRLDFGARLSRSLVERDQPHRVLLVDHQVAQRRGQADRVVELGQLLAVRVAHRPAQVHHQIAGDVRLGLELLDVVLVRLGVDQPVDVLRIVARVYLRCSLNSTENP
jgi:hypothetical protein